MMCRQRRNFAVSNASPVTSLDWVIELEFTADLRIMEDLPIVVMTVMTKKREPLMVHGSVLGNRFANTDSWGGWSGPLGPRPRGMA